MVQYGTYGTYLTIYFFTSPSIQIRSVSGLAGPLIMWPLGSKTVPLIQDYVYAALDPKGIFTDPQHR